MGALGWPSGGGCIDTHLALSLRFGGVVLEPGAGGTLMSSGGGPRGQTLWQKSQVFRAEVRQRCQTASQPL